jgi:hypothetical protein
MIILIFLFILRTSLPGGAIRTVFKLDPSRFQLISDLIRTRKVTGSAGCRTGGDLTFNLIAILVNAGREPGFRISL